jgi:hypothetical protein
LGAAEVAAQGSVSRFTTTAPMWCALRRRCSCFAGRTGNVAANLRVAGRSVDAQG